MTRGLVPLVLEERRLVLMSVAVSLAFVALEASSVGLIFPFLEAFKNLDGNSRRLLEIGAGILGLLAMKGAIEYWQRTRTSKLHHRIRIRVRDGLTRRFLKDDLMQFSSKESSDWMYLYSQQAESVPVLLQSYLDLATLGLICAGYVGWLLFLDWQVTAVVLALSIPMLILSRLIRRGIERAATKKLQAEQESDRLTWDDLIAGALIRTTKTGPERVRMHQDNHRRLLRESLRMDHWRSLHPPLQEWVNASILIIGALAFASFWPETLAARLPGALGAVFILHRLQGRLGTVSLTIGNLGEALAESKGVLEFLEGKVPEMEGPGTRTQVTGIEIRNLVFAYPKGRPVLDQVSLSLGPGLTALMGPSGSGKTTLARIASGLYPPQGGEVHWLNSDGKKGSPIQLGMICYVQHEGVIFNESLEWNLTLGRSYPDGEVKEVIRSVGLQKLVSELPEGLSTPLGFAGKRLSAGQKQRVALARALLPRPSVLILDEVTHAVDSETRDVLMTAIRQAAKECIVLMITHQPEVAARADRVLILKDGKLSALQNANQPRLLEPTQKFE